jgi:hypothetical protein
MRLDHSEDAHRDRKDQRPLDVQAEDFRLAPTWPIAEAPTERFWGLIILSITPPEELVAPASAGSMPRLWAVTVCIGPKRAFVRRGIRTRQDYPEPSYKRREEREEKTRAGER